MCWLIKCRSILKCHEFGSASSLLITLQRTIKLLLWTVILALTTEQLLAVALIQLVLQMAL